jgi:hypothetical protein
VSETVCSFVVFSWLDLSRDNEDGEENAARGDAEDEDGAAQGLALVRCGTGGCVAAEAASLGASSKGKSEREGESRDREYALHNFWLSSDHYFPPYAPPLHHANTERAGTPDSHPTDEDLSVGIPVRSEWGTLAPEPGLILGNLPLIENPQVSLAGLLKSNFRLGDHLFRVANYDRGHASCPLG